MTDLPISVLLVEDSEYDAELILDVLVREGYQVTSERVETRAALEAALIQHAWDVILCDYRLPQLDALEVIAALNDSGRDIPLLIISGTIGEASVVAAMKAGAGDFLNKSELARLVPAIQREMRETATRRERQEALEALRRSEANFQLLAEKSQHGIQIIQDGKIVYTNPAMAAMTGYPIQEFAGMPVEALLAIMHAEDRSTVEAQVQGRLAWEEVSSSVEVRLIRKDSDVRWVQFFINPIEFDGKPAILVTIVDFTERKRAEETVRQMQDRFIALTENAPDGIALIERDGKMKFVSPAGRRMFGYGLDEKLEIDPEKQIHPDELPAVLAALANLIENPTQNPTLQYRFRHRDGAWLWLESTFTNLLSVKSVEAIVINFRDVTERKRAEEKNEQHLERLTALREVDQLIASTFNLQIGLDALLSRVLRFLDVDAATVLMLDSIEKTLVYGAGIGFHTTAAHAADVRLGESLAGKIALERDILHARIGPGEPGHPLLTDNLKREDFVSYAGAPLIIKGKVIGVLEVFNRSLTKQDQDWLAFFEILAGQTAILIENAQLFNGLEASNLELSLAYDVTIEGWSRALDLRDKETEGHTQRVTDLTMLLARRMGIAGDELLHIYRGALLHDIGKLGVPDQILLKPDTLTDAEREIMQQHPVFAYELLSPIRYLKSAAIDIPHYHHEKWDGTGYPHRLKGEGIPLAARIFAVVDVWDALTSERPYRPAWEKEKALAYIRSESGRHFDPIIVEAFFEMLSTPQ